MTDTVKNTIITLRTNAGQTQQELAEAIGVTRQTIIAIERGNYAPSVLLALKLARHFHVAVEQLFSITYEK